MVVQDAHEGHEVAVGDSWLVFVDATGVGAAVAEALRTRGHRVRTVEHRSVDELTEVDGEYVMNTGCPGQMSDLIKHVSAEGGLTGIVDCWPAFPGVSSSPTSRIWAPCLRAWTSDVSAMSSRPVPMSPK